MSNITILLLLILLLQVCTAYLIYKLFPLIFTLSKQFKNLEQEEQDFRRQRASSLAQYQKCVDQWRESIARQKEYDDSRDQYRRQYQREREQDQDKRQAAWAQYEKNCAADKENWEKQRAEYENDSKQWDKQRAEHENDRKQWHTTLQRLETLLDKWEKKST